MTIVQNFEQEYLQRFINLQNLYTNNPKRTI